MVRPDAFITELQAIVGVEYALHKPEDVIVFEYDGSVDRALPRAVVLPANTLEVSGILKAANKHGVPVVARGAGTGLSGGAISEHNGIVVAMTRMKEVFRIDPDNMLALVGPGVVNIDLSYAASKHGLYYAPDPSSQKVCTIGGNVAENSGGPHCLAYGVTTNHVLGMEVVLADGSMHWLGGSTREATGYDLRGIMVGSEGTLAIVTKVAVRLLRKPEAVKTLLAVFKEIEQASQAVTAIIGAGIVPAAIEMMDHLCIKAVEPSVNAGYPADAGAVLLVEVDGLAEAVEEEAVEIERICNRYGPLEIRTATDQAQRDRLWAGRKGVLGALGRLAPNFYLVDGTIPRTRLVEVLARINEVSKQVDLPIANLLHAGDGNLHPSVLFDERNPDELRRALHAGGEILKICVEYGGVLSGEHGIGLEKQEYMPLMFTEADMSAMAKLKPAFATNDMLNPGKVFPKGGGHARVAKSGGISRAGAGAYV